MSAKSFPERLPYNSPGRFYVNEQCLDCDLCREAAPTAFKRNNSEGASYIFKQPENEEEISQTLEAPEGCPCEAIFDDGEEHDWTEPTKAKRPEWRMDKTKKPTCKHCSLSKKKTLGAAEKIEIGLRLILSFVFGLLFAGSGYAAGSVIWAGIGILLGIVLLPLGLIFGYFSPEIKALFRWILRDYLN